MVVWIFIIDDTYRYYTLYLHVYTSFLWKGVLFGDSQLLLKYQIIGQTDTSEIWICLEKDLYNVDGSDWRFDGLSDGHPQSQVKSIRQVRLFMCLVCSVTS